MATRQLLQNFSSLTYVQKFGCFLAAFQLLSGLFYIDIVSGDKCNNFGTGHCICTDENVTCHGEHALDNNIYALYSKIGDDVSSITITGSNFTDLNKNIFGSCQRTSELVLKRLKYLDLSSNNIHTIHGKTFHCMPHLHTLILAHNEWQLERKQNHSGFFTSTPELVHLDLKNAFEEMWNGSYHIPKLVDVLNVTNLTRLETLDLSMNEFFVFGQDAAAALCQMVSLKTLNLSNNALQKPELKDCMKNLTTLDLSNNSMSIIPENLRDVIDSLTRLQEVRLDRNRYECDCGFIATHRWLRQTRAPINKNDLRCYSGYHSSYIGKAVLTLEESDLKCQPIPQQSSKAAFVVAGLIFAIIACSVVAFMFINRKQLKYCLGTCKKKTSRFSLRPHAGYSSVREVATVENL